jgi:rare lipoprotein A (peptidoglycan hydrolase)
MYKKGAIVILIMSALFAGCSSTARFTQNPQVQQEPAVIHDSAPSGKQTEAAENFDPSTVSTPLEVEIGVASYYADKYNGKPTATGVIYDMNGISAAHPFHPLGTIARITNLVNNKSVILEINDRMPYRPDRIIDLSLGAARELDMVLVGIQKVKIEVLKWGSGKRIERVKNPS